MPWNRTPTPWPAASPLRSPAPPFSWTVCRNRSIRPCPGKPCTRWQRLKTRQYGGFGGAPKFPPSAVLEFLIRHAAFPSPSVAAGTQAQARDLAGRTLAAMARSALFDQLDGGFARYCVTRDWSVPHFEKMLYDNAQLLRVYVHWVRLGGTSGYPAAEAADVAGRTAGWLLASLGLGTADAGDGEIPGQLPESLASSLDADALVDGVPAEGASYVWTPAALEDILGKGDGDAVARLMNVHLRGTVSADGSPLHPGRALSADEAELWQRVRPALLAGRSRRPQPARDDKVVAGWNGLAVAALAEAGAVLGQPRLVAAAGRIAEYLERVHWRPGADGGPGTLMRVSHDGVARGIGGLLEDYAFCAEGLIALYAVSGRTRWYRLAEDILAAACARFTADGTLQDAAGESEQVANAQGGRASLDPFDNATPSGAAAFAGALLSCSALSGSHEYRTLAGNILALLPPLATRAPRAAGWLLATAQAELAGPVEAAVVGPDTPERAALHHELLRSPSPGMVIALQADARRAGAAPAARPGGGPGRLAAGLPVPRHGLRASGGFCQPGAGAPRQHGWMKSARTARGSGRPVCEPRGPQCRTVQFCRTHRGPDVALSLIACATSLRSLFSW